MDLFILAIDQSPPRRIEQVRSPPPGRRSIQSPAFGRSAPSPVLSRSAPSPAFGKSAPSPSPKSTSRGFESPSQSRQTHMRSLTPTTGSGMPSKNKSDRFNLRPFLRPPVVHGNLHGVPLCEFIFLFPAWKANKKAFVVRFTKLAESDHASILSVFYRKRHHAFGFTRG